MEAASSSQSHRFDFFEPGEKTALVCVENPEFLAHVNEQLAGLGFKIHTGLFPEDCILKLRAHAYDVVLVSDNFQGSTPEDHPILVEISRMPASQRRQQVVVLVGSNLKTNDDLGAFARSVDLLISDKDLANLRPIVRRAIARTQEFYAPLHEAIGHSQRHEIDNRTHGFAHTR